MSSSTITPPQPISISIPPSLRHLAISLPQYLSENPQYDCLVVGACIFAPQHRSQLNSDSSSPRLLLVQRAATERAFPNLWEIPGGSSEVTDPTVLHSLAREVFEETGLHLTRVVRQVGKGVEFGSRPREMNDDGGGGVKPRKSFLKLTFEIEVAEFEASRGDTPLTCRYHGGTAEVEQNPSAPANSDDSVAAPTVTIHLDPEEHQRYDWVTKERFTNQDYMSTYPTISESQRETILQAFAQKC